MKKCIFTILLCLNSILAVALILFFGILRTYIGVYLPLGVLLVLPILVGIIFICEAVLLSVGISRLFSKMKLRRVWGAVISLVLIGTVLFIPHTKAFGILNYKTYNDLRREFVESLDSKLNECPQIDVDTYYVGDTRLSYTGKVMVDITDEATKVRFDVYLTTVLIYTSNDKVENTDFAGGMPNGYYIQYKSLKKLDDNWWLATH